MLTPAPHIRRRATLVLISIAALLAAACVAWLDASRAASPSVAAFPSPGSRLARTKTQIAFRGVPASQFGTIVVSGSRSGLHSGRVQADSDGDGGSFLPDAPFTPNEVVTVKSALNVLDASHGSFSFTVADPAGRIPYLPLGPAPRAGGRRPLPLEPGLAESDGRGRPAARPHRPRRHLRGAAAGADVRTAEVFDSSGQLVWFHTLSNKRDWAADFRFRTCAGRPGADLVGGLPGAGIGVDKDMIFDSSYRPVATVNAANGLSADLHEFRLTPQGTALITAYFPVFWDASKDNVK